MQYLHYFMQILHAIFARVIAPLMCIVQNRHICNSLIKIQSNTTKSRSCLYSFFVPSVLSFSRSQTNHVSAVASPSPDLHPGVGVVIGQNAAQFSRDGPSRPVLPEKGILRRRGGSSGVTQSHRKFQRNIRLSTEHSESER